MRRSSTATVARSLALSFALAITFVLPSTASATPNFPQAIQSYAGSPNTPACAICHVGAQQRGTVITPFGTNMRARGLVEFDEGSLVRALDTMVADHVDSDGDGDTDVDALKAGRDPNEPAAGGGGGGGGVPLQPRYGCGAHVAPTAYASTNQGASLAAPLAMGIAIAVTGCIRRARRRSRSRRSKD